MTALQSRREACRKYRNSPNGRAKRAAYTGSAANKAIQERWRKSVSGKVSMKKYRKSDRRKAVLRKYYQSGKGRKATDRYQKTDKGRESLLRGVHKRRARMSMTICDLTTEQSQEIKAMQGQRCAHCQQVKPLTRDHIIPLVAGGQHTASNIQALCRSCNSRKGKVIGIVAQSGKFQQSHFREATSQLFLQL